MLGEQGRGGVSPTALVRRTRERRSRLHGAARLANGRRVRNAREAARFSHANRLTLEPEWRREDRTCLQTTDSRAVAGDGVVGGADG